MATPVASVSTGNNNQNAFAQSLDSGNDPNRLRLDGSVLSAFDLLLDIPFFETKIEAASSYLDRHPIEEGDEEVESESSDDDSDLPSSDPDRIPIALTTVNRIDERFIRESSSTATPELTIDHDQVQVASESSTDESSEKRLLKAPTVSGKEKPSEIETRQATDDSLLESNNSPIDAHAPPEGAENLVAVPGFEYQHLEPSESKAEIHPEIPVSDQRTRNQNTVSSKTQPAVKLKHVDTQQIDSQQVDSQQIDRQQIDTPVEQKGDLKSTKRAHRPNLDRESSDKLSGNTRLVNRRSERLADVKRNNPSQNDNESNESDNTDSVDHQGNIEIPSELLLDSTAIDPAQCLVPSVSLPNSNVSDSSIVPTSATTPIIATVNAATTIVTTSIAGQNSDRTAIITGVVGAQVGVTTSENYADSIPSAPLARGSTLSTYQEQRVLHRVMKGLDQLDDGGGQVRLRLHPPELGSLQITLRVEAQQVSALIEVEHTSAREVLLSNLPQLQSRLADQGMNVSQFDVQVVDSNQFSQGSGPGWESSNGRNAGQNDSESNRSSRYVDRMRNQLERAPKAEGTRSMQSLWTRKNGELDLRF